jgi:acetyl-CoA carboxylase biotin carboxyl carrier protein
VNIEQIKELIEILENSKLNKLSFKDEKGCELSLEKAENQHPFFPTHLHQGYHTTPPATPHVVQTAKHEEVTSSYITAPMVGTCYLTQAPGEPAFVKVGDTVTENSLVCIIEAMKVMNEIKAGVKGKIVEICVRNAHPIEFGTKLFRVEP